MGLFSLLKPCHTLLTLQAGSPTPSQTPPPTPPGWWAACRSSAWATSPASTCWPGRSGDATWTSVTSDHTEPSPGYCLFSLVMSRVILIKCHPHSQTASPRHRHIRILEHYHVSDRTVTRFMHIQTPSSNDILCHISRLETYASNDPLGAKECNIEADLSIYISDVRA